VRRSGFASGLLCLLLASACDRGCGSRWIATRKETVTDVPSLFAPALDCPDGLARCVGGVLEASDLARIPMPCKASEGKGQCACPWRAVGECPRGCLAEGVEVVSTPDRAAGRLCLDPANPRDAASLDDDEDANEAGM
jgi:hypothetical protein